MEHFQKQEQMQRENAFLEFMRTPDMEPASISLPPHPAALRSLIETVELFKPKGKKN